MKIAPLKTTDPWYSRILQDPTSDSDALSDVQTDNVVQMELVEILHRGPDENYRPFLHLRGTLSRITPLSELPYGITELPFGASSGPMVDAFYDFDARQLSKLVEKGYFDHGFGVPDAMTGIEWELPGTVDLLVVAPASYEQTPLVFVAVHDQSTLELTQGTSGYDLSEYFPEREAGLEGQASQRAQQSGYSRGDGRDMFEDLVIEQGAPSQRVGAVRAQEAQVVPDGVFDQLLAEALERQEREAEEARRALAERVPEPGTAEAVYRERIAPSAPVAAAVVPAEAEIEAEALTAEAATEAAAEAAPAAPAEPDAAPSAPAEVRSSDGLEWLDFDEPEEELGIAPIRGSIGADEAHRRAAARDQARRKELADLIEADVQSSPPEEDGPER